eukprot:m.224607 g.224607  ORF g.224607 m.224607 type:complete len:645 (+) comp39997_c0_seq2:1393-3327(+)
MNCYSSAHVLLDSCQNNVCKMLTLCNDALLLTAVFHFCRAQSSYPYPTFSTSYFVASSFPTQMSPRASATSSSTGFTSTVPPTSAETSQPSRTQTDPIPSTVSSPSSNPPPSSAKPTPSFGPIRTCGGTAALGSPCYFPFTYNKTEYSECTTEGSSQPWCATQPGDYEIHGLWGFCNCAGRVFAEQCQTYKSGRVCGQYRRNQTVLISQSSSPDFILDQVDQLMAPIAAFIDELGDEDSCLDVFTETLCHFIFPSCRSSGPGSQVGSSHLCKETCNQLLYGNCSASYVRGTTTIAAFAERFSLPSFIYLGVPRCGFLASKAEDPGCMDVQLSLGYVTDKVTTEPNSTASRPPSTATPGTSSGTSTMIVIIAAAGAGTLTLVLVVLTVIVFVLKHLKKKKKTSFVTFFDGKGAIIENKSEHFKDLTKLNNGTLEIFNPQYEPCETSGITMKQALRKESQLGLSIGKAPFDATSVLLSGGKDVAEISTDEIKYIEDLGEGQFGMVFLGELVDKTLVAVKVLKEDADEKNQKEFLKEFSIMSQLQHPNIVSLVAQCTTKTSPIECLVFEFMCYGDLGEFLRKSVLADATVLMEAGRKGGKHQIVKNDLLRIIIQLCEACVYLEDKRFVHRDIATRNCLIGEKLGQSG